MNSWLKYKIPNKKKWLLTIEFLTTFKEELDRIFETNTKGGRPTYWNTYAWLDGTGGFYNALKVTCEKYNVRKAIYEYARNLPWYHGDSFNSELTIIMREKGIIDEGNLDEIDYPSREELLKWERNGEIEWVEEITHHKGYFVNKRDWRFVESK